MKFSIIIPTYNKVELLKACLESVITYTDLSDTEIIIVANGCTDGTESYLTIRMQTCREIKVLWFTDPLGYTKATNVGILHAKGEYIILLNNDVLIEKTEKQVWIDMLVKPFLQDEKVGITGAVKVAKPELLNKPFLIFFCVMLRKSMLDEIGMLDEALNPGYGDDFDLCMRSEQFGYKTVQVPDETPLDSDGKQYLSNFPIYHVGTATFKDVSEYPEVVKRNTKIIEERWGKKEEHFDGFKDIEVPKRETGDIPELRVGNIQRAKSIDGFMLESELLVLAQLASTAKVFIEIGSWHGRSSAAIVDNLPEGSVLYCIDTWKGTDGENGAHDSAKTDDGDNAYIIFLNHHFKQIQSGKIVPLRMTGRNAYFLILAQKIVPDVVFIDGDHSYEPVTKDLGMWGKFANIDCLICGHDYVWDHEGVIKAVDEHYGKKNISVHPNTSIWKYTPKKSVEESVELIKEAQRQPLRLRTYKDSIENENGSITETMEDGTIFNYKTLSVLEDDSDHEIKVTVGIPTKNRYDSLAHCLQSIIFQTCVIHEIIIVDDTVEPKDIRQIPIFNYLLGLAMEKGIKWRYIYGQRKGQHVSHQTLQEQAEGNWIFRIDDDCVAEPECLACLVEGLNILETEETNIGAIAPLVLSPDAQEFTSGRNMIKHIDGPNVQWFKQRKDGVDARWVESQDHLHSCFLYRKGITTYETNLSPVAHREETLFTYKIHKAGYELRIDPGAVVYHFRSETGGIRSHTDKSYFDHDEGVFRSLLSLWNANPDDKKIVVLDNGIGDHWAFKNILAELIEKHGSVKIACCYPEVFFDTKESVEIISIQDAKNMFWGNIDEFSIYRKMVDWGWKPEDGNLVAAYRKLYLDGNS